MPKADPRLTDGWHGAKVVWRKSNPYKGFEIIVVIQQEGKNILGYNIIVEKIVL
jgi:hypothetical protein